MVRSSFVARCDTPPGSRSQSAVPEGFRPMAELERQRHRVEMVVAGTGEIVVGWLALGLLRGRRFYLTMGRHGGAVVFDAIGWREIPTAVPGGRLPAGESPGTNQREAA